MGERSLTSQKGELCIEYFSEIINFLNSTSQYERVFHLIVFRLAHLYNCQSSAIILIDPKTEYLTVAGSYGLSQTFCNEFRKKLATGAIGKLLWTGKHILIKDSEAQQELSHEVRLENDFASCVCIQIVIDHRTIGYLYADSRIKYAFNENDLQLFQTFANIAGMAYNKHQLYEENLKLERIDKETGADKYSTFIERVKLTLEIAQKSAEEFCIILLDVDNYKSISNTYGYNIAIELLQQLVKLIKFNKLSLCCVGRYGSDEIMVLFEHCNLKKGFEIADKLRRNIEKAKFTQRNISTTTSVGISCFPANADTLEDLIITVKNALFDAQRTGKNKVCYYLKEWYAKDSARIPEIEGVA